MKRQGLAAPVYDAEQAEHLAAEGAAEAFAGALDEWKALAVVSVEWCAANLETFCSDDVHKRITALGWTDTIPVNKKALGTIMADARKTGRIRSIGATQSAVTTAHRGYITLWTAT